jgi:predicted nucleic acid-binding protein
VLLDIATDDPSWASWSLYQLDAAAIRGPVIINAVIYAEFSIGYTQIEEVEQVLADAGLELREIPRPALFLAGKVFQRYRAQRGSAFCRISSHAAVAGLPLLTRDARRYRAYFSGYQTHCARHKRAGLLRAIKGKGAVWTGRSEGGVDRSDENWIPNELPRSSIGLKRPPIRAVLWLGAP